MVSSDLYIDLGETDDPNSFGLTRRKLSSVFQRQSISLIFDLGGMVIFNPNHGEAGSGLSQVDLGAGLKLLVGK